MAGHRIRSNDPGGRVPAVEGSGSEMVLVATRGPSNVRRLQRRLWAVAKRSPGRRFHALYDRIHRDDVLWEAWERVRRNRGAAGVDRVTLVAVEEYGVERMLGELARALRGGTYRPAPVRRRAILKPDGGVRPLARIAWGDEQSPSLLPGKEEDEEHPEPEK